ncbi:hypothetical protein [Fulvimonas soli]|jgi:hypothetical protein|uniref:Uncharacterized protein n=1 Tax=Fulvimonas soli TaxID=155197 RepID=A0A316IFU2_9GAMM|nr:hypothetical protein [Fulvimonas soli]PWK91889.1 hypothetical protein C7456_1038 [Fulvimonas soli]TNY26016.1 hypothetical protein BV497_10705 [Fulvimonas soli]
MKRLRIAALAGALLMASHAALAASSSLSPFPPKLLPVLVNVNAQGKVTKASPAMELPPNLNRLLQQNLDELITGPAHARDRAVSSQFIVNLYLKTAPRADGSFDASFAYASTQPVPPGSWHWANIDDRRLALVSDSARPYRMINRVPRDGVRGLPPLRHQGPSQPTMPAPAATRVASSTTPNAGGHGR